MVNKIPSLVDYPIFRLTISMAAGIFLSDYLMRQFGWSMFVYWIFVGTLLVLLMGLWMTCRLHAYGKRRVFGVLTMLFFVVLGGFRLMQERQQIDFSWSSSTQVYWGEVLTPPVKRGKMLQAEVQVELQVDSLVGSDSLSSPKISKLSPTSSSSSLSSSSVSSSSSTLSSSSVSSSSSTLSSSSTSSSSSFQTNVLVSIPIHRRILLYWMPDSLQRPLRCGDKLLFSSVISNPVSDEEITGFDYATYLYRKGIGATAMAFVGDWKGMGRRESLSLKELSLLCREKIVSRYRQWNMKDDEFAVVAALTVGDKSVLTSSLKERYSAAGVSHVLALSGLHIGILSAILSFLLVPLKRFPYGGILRSIVVVEALWAFAFISGLSPSVVRAVTMCSLYFLATLFTEEQFPGVYALFLAAFLMLIYQPLYVFDLSCQLSFLAVASILYFYPVISRCLSCKNRIVSWLWNSIAVSVSAQLGTLPLILYYFGSFPTYFLLANLIVSVLAVCVLCGAIFALLCSSLPVVGTLSVTFLTRSTLCMNTSIRWIQQLTGSQVDILSTSLLQTFCGFLFIYTMYQYLIYRRARSILCMLISINVILGEWVYHSMTPKETAVYYTHSQLYLKQSRKVRELVSTNGLFEVDTLKIGILTTATWKNKESVPKIPMDYLILARGFRGNILQLSRVFHIRQLILDTSLSPRYREYLLQESNDLKIPCILLSGKGSYKIIL